jgi:hypothetical protein
MKQIGLVRSAVPPHGRHANTTGTDISGGGGGSSRTRRSEFERAEINQNGVLPGLKIDVRQGIARTRRHVAPARSLC